MGVCIVLRLKKKESHQKPSQQKNACVPRMGGKAGCVVCIIEATGVGMCVQWGLDPGCSVRKESSGRPDDYFRIPHPSSERPDDYFRIPHPSSERPDDHFRFLHLSSECPDDHFRIPHLSSECPDDHFRVLGGLTFGRGCVVLAGIPPLALLSERGQGECEGRGMRRCLVRLHRHKTQ